MPPIEADIILHGGPVVSLCDSIGTARGLALKDGRILFVGDQNAALSYQGPRTEVIDLRGRSALPGFIDAHSHFLWTGMKRLAVDCTFGPVKTLSDVFSALEQKAARTPKGRWVRGVRFSDFRIEEKRFPTREELDRAVPDHPVWITRTCCHTSVVNSLALKLAGLTDNSPDPPGGVMERKNGRLTGVLKETAQDAIRLAARPDEDELLQAVGLAGEYYLANGVTSTHDMGGRFREETAALVRARREGLLPVRIYSTIVQGQAEWLHGNLFWRSGLSTGFGDDFLRIGPLKLFLDGAEDSGTAAMTTPYPDDPENYGVAYLEQKELDELTFRAHRANFQISIHAIGDQAVKMAVGSIEKALLELPRADHRHRIEHAVFMPPGALARMSSLKIIPVLQPIFLATITDEYLKKVGRSRLQDAYYVKSFLDGGLPIPGSSDCPVEPVNPLLGIKAAMLRRCETGEVFLPSERIGLGEALKMFGPHAAYASFEEMIKGTLEPGKLADVVVLSGDVLTTSPEELDLLEVDLTISDGRMVYRRRDQA
ncbi:MAG: amidohydrolase [Pseudomonadota bacterium]